MYVTTSGVDPSGLGRWSWYLLEGKEGYQARVITAYAHGGSTVNRSATYYRQQVRYIAEKALKTSPKQMVREDLLN